MRTINTQEELDALPSGALIWYWVEWDATRIHALMQKWNGQWCNVTEIDDDYPYVPVLPAYVLEEGGEL